MISSIKYFIFFLLFLQMPLVSAEETIRLASGEWPPYQSRALKHGGFVTRIVKESFAIEGIKTEYGYFPWKRSYYFAENGEWDGTFIWFDLPERRKHFYISDSIIVIKYVFFHLKSYSFNWKDIDDLKGIRVGATLAYDYGESFQNAEQNGKLQVIRKSSDMENFIRLSKNYIHIFPCDLYAGYEIINKYFKPNEAILFTHHSKPIKEAPHHLFLTKINKNNKKIITRFNAGLKRLKETGKYDEYFAESQIGEYQLQKYPKSE